MCFQSLGEVPRAKVSRDGFGRVGLTLAINLFWTSNLWWWVVYVRSCSRIAIGQSLVLQDNVTRKSPGEKPLPLLLSDSLQPTHGCHASPRKSDTDIMSLMGMCIRY